MVFDGLFDIFWSKVWPRCHPADPADSALFYCYYRPLRAGEVWLGCGPQSGAASVWIPIGFRSWTVESAGGGGFADGPGLSLFLNGPLAPHQSGYVPETGGLYSAVTHHTHYTVRGLGSFNLDLIGLPLLVREWGLVLPHPVRDVPVVAGSIRVKSINNTVCTLVQWHYRLTYGVSFQSLLRYHNRNQSGNRLKSITSEYVTLLVLTVCGHILHLFLYCNYCK